MDSVRPATGNRLITGHAELRRVGWRRFPVNELFHDGEVVARLGHLGWLRIYLGNGVMVELADATSWRIRAATIGGYVRPLVVDGQRRKVALGSGGHGVYGVTGRDFGYSLNPGARPRSPDAEWVLRHHEDNVATVRRRPMRFDSVEPVHLAAVLLSMVLMQYGVPDDSRTGMPKMHWG